jgi:hypothetical protein
MEQVAELVGYLQTWLEEGRFVAQAVERLERVREAG